MSTTIYDLTEPLKSIEPQRTNCVTFSQWATQLEQAELMTTSYGQHDQRGIDIVLAAPIVYRAAREAYADGILSMPDYRRALQWCLAIVDSEHYLYRAGMYAERHKHAGQWCN